MNTRIPVYLTYREGLMKTEEKKFSHPFEDVQSQEAYERWVNGTLRNSEKEKRRLPRWLVEAIKVLKWFAPKVAAWFEQSR